MSSEAVAVLILLGFLAGCAPERGRIAHLDADAVCVEPVPVSDAGPFTRIAQAAGYLQCRHGWAAAEPSAGRNRRQLIAVAAVEEAMGAVRVETRPGHEPIWADTCRAAIREAERPDAWPESRRVVDACWRLELIEASPP